VDRGRIDDVRVEQLVADRDREGDEAAQHTGPGAGAERTRAVARRGVLRALEGRRLREGDQALLVVRPAGAAVGMDQPGAVVGVPAGVPWTADQQVEALARGHAPELLGDVRLVLEIDGDGVLGPNPEGRGGARGALGEA